MNIEATDLFTSLSHETRLRCLMLLKQQGELCVCELTYAIAAAQPHISRHLAQMRALGLIVDRKSGLWVYYQINPALPIWVKQILEAVAAGSLHLPPFKNDLNTLHSMPNRPGAFKCA